MEKIRQRDSGFSQSHGRTADEHGVIGHDFPFPHCADNPPAAVIFDFLSPLRPGENEIGISMRYIFE